MKEADAQRVILDWLGYKKIFHWRHNTGSFMRQDKSGKSHFYRFGGMKGSPDIFAIKKGKIYGIEVKSLKGKQSKDQKEYEKNFKKAGGKYILAYTLEDVIEEL